MTWRCYNCGYVNEEEANFCIACDELKEDSIDKELEYNYNNHNIFGHSYFIDED